MVRRINEKLIILVKYLSGFGSAEIHLTAEVKVKGFALVVIGWGAHAHCYEIVIGLAGFWDDQFINHKVDPEVFLIFSHPFKLKKTPSILLTENEGFKKVFIDLFAWVVFLDALVLKITTKQSICIH